MRKEEQKTASRAFRSEKRDQNSKKQKENFGVSPCFLFRKEGIKRAAKNKRKILVSPSFEKRGDQKSSKKQKENFGVSSFSFRKEDQKSSKKQKENFGVSRAFRSEKRGSKEQQKTKGKFWCLPELVFSFRKEGIKRAAKNKRKILVSPRAFLFVQKRGDQKPKTNRACRAPKTQPTTHFGEVSCAENLALDKLAAVQF
jgi:hypothetical protein